MKGRLLSREKPPRMRAGFTFTEPMAQHFKSALHQNETDFRNERPAERTLSPWGRCLFARLCRSRRTHRQLITPLPGKRDSTEVRHMDLRDQQQETTEGISLTDQQQRFINPSSGVIAGKVGHGGPGGAA